MTNDEYDIEECGCEECPTCYRREIRGLEKALQVMTEARAADAVRTLALLNRWLSQHRDGGTADLCGVAPELVAETRDAVSAGTLTSADNGRR